MGVARAAAPRRLAAAYQRCGCRSRTSPSRSAATDSVFINQVDEAGIDRQIAAVGGVECVGRWPGKPRLTWGFVVVGDARIELATSSVSRKRATTAPIALVSCEVETGFEPVYPALQAVASPLGHSTGPADPLRADDGTRTRDPHLGKVMLYQLSHVRVRLREIPRARAHTIRCSPSVQLEGP